MTTFTSSKIIYLYLISKSGFADFVTNSFEIIEPYSQSTDSSLILNSDNKNTTIRVHNLEIDDLQDYDYVTLDYTTGGLKNGYLNKYINSEGLSFYKIMSKEVDRERNIAVLNLEKTDGFDLVTYKRMVRIETIIDK